MQSIGNALQIGFIVLGLVSCQYINKQEAINKQELQYKYNCNKEESE